MTFNLRHTHWFRQLSRLSNALLLDLEVLRKFRRCIFPALLLILWIESQLSHTAIYRLQGSFECQMLHVWKLMYWGNAEDHTGNQFLLPWRLCYKDMKYSSQAYNAHVSNLHGCWIFHYSILVHAPNVEKDFRLDHSSILCIRLTTTIHRVLGFCEGQHLLGSNAERAYQFENIALTLSQSG